MPEERIERLFDAHQPRLFRLARRLARNREDALDLVQETFVRAARRLASLPPGEAGEEAWLVRTLVNLARDLARRARVRDRHRRRLAPATSREADPAAALDARGLVRAALAQLPARRRAVVVLHEIEERNVGEISKLLGIARVTVRWHLAIGRRELRAILAELGGRAS